MQQTFETWATTKKMEERRLEVFVNMLQALAGGPQGYRLRRILLTNFWLYGQQEFEIPHGRLFLAGENASGKSTVLTAALPLALDGDLRPNRIDTFGGRERHIDYYVLGGTESATPFRYERRTAYIALEFEWCNPDMPPIAPEMRQRWENSTAEQREKLRFLTIGLSLAGNANIGDRIRPLRFLITDGSRLGYDLHTVYDTGNKQEKRAYDHPHFKQILEGHGILCESQAEYERQVGRHLFGFTDVKDFQKLINLLLVLRRPNLSTELNFSRVHEYLKQSLRKISSETTHRVIGTIERIDSIQSEIERIQEAYDSTDRVHQAVQQLVLARVQLASNEYVDAQQAEDAIHGKATKLRRDVTTADNERKKADTRSQALQAQLSQISGQIRALENSEGLQVAKQLETARERMQESEAQMQMQEQSVTSARHALDALTDALKSKLESFTKTKADSTTQLEELLKLAANECYWELAAFQIEEARRILSGASTETTTPPRVPQAVAMLIGEQSQERIDWLRSLEALHQQRERADDKLQNARSLEITRFQELDEARRRFQSIQDRVHETRQKLNEVLDNWIAVDSRLFPSESIESSLAMIALDENFQAAENSAEDGSHATVVLLAVTNALNGYRQILEALEQELLDGADQIQGELNEVQLLTGSKRQQLSTLEEEYEHKRAEPEYVPPRPSRRTQARIELAKQGIAAFPLYMLLDFVPGLDSKEAGRIEYMLEDAGLLDALVVPPTDITAADPILAREGLSDCRLNMELFNSNQSNGHHTELRLRFDEAFNDDGQDTSTSDWQRITTNILATLGQTQAIATTNVSFSEDGTWTHGLLTGRANGGEALCIGKATRLRVKQRELAILEAQHTQLEGELHALHQRLAEFEQQLTQLQEQQSKVRRLLPESGIEEQYAQLTQAKFALDDGNGKYQRARQHTQELRQLYTSLVAQLERESQGIGPLASHTKQVQQAIEGTMSLRTQAKTLQVQFGTLIRTWNDYQKDQTSLESAKANEATSTMLYERVRQQALQTRAEFQELHHIAEQTDVEGLGERLRTLREQNEEFSKQLEDARAVFIRADERTNNAQIQLTEIEIQLQFAHSDTIDKQARFIQVLTAYPVEQLSAIQQLVTANENTGPIRAAKQVIADISRDGDDEHTLSRRERLDTAYRDAYSALSKVFNREQAFLLEYGPDLDDQGRVQFLNENKSRPIELLHLLSERIEMQRTLLGQEERQLFEDFLLQEIAEAIRTHILEAEEWVQQINTVLSGLPMIGEHYALQWKPLGEFDPSMLGGHLAQHYKLLRKPVQTLTTEESETLMAAFRQEIESVRIRQQEMPDMNFMDALEQVFDYREWFHFDVWVTPIGGGQRQRLTDRVAGTRSGAEQLFALYVPLFAALGALYRTAAPGAPRLLALDEAFDKVSVINTQRIMEFLVSQDFQWIMTGPQVSGTGAKIPASARYLMLHEKGSPIATASASFWSDSQDLQNGQK
ncbi:MAG: TIGR02680 family protein [Ktedonobacteraceae bacterium]